MNGTSISMGTESSSLGDQGSEAAAFQAFEIQKPLPGARVVTADKFQGQEAPIPIYSTATSSPAAAPRRMEFLYRLNRLNVATSPGKMRLRPGVFSDAFPS